MGVQQERVFVGCYTGESGGAGEGIVSLLRDPETGRLSGRTVAARTPSPSFLARHPSLPVLYAVNELAEGTVSSWAVDPQGALTPLAVRSTGGAHPCHLAVTADGRHLAVANYGSGSVTVLPLDPDGVPGDRTDLVQHEGHGVDPERQDGPHAHMVAPGLGADLLAVDLGVDRVFRHRLDAVSGRVVESATVVDAAPGAGPRHLTRHPDGTIFVAAELAATVTAYRAGAADGALRPGWSGPASAARGEVFPSEIVVGRDGRFLYVGNRGPDTITVFAVADGAAEAVAETPTGGTWPRHLTLVGHRLHVANERSHSVTTFAVDPADGCLAPAGAPVEVPSPTCLLWWPGAATLA